MRKIISFAAAFAVAVTSFSTIASAESLVDLDIKTKWPGESEYSDHDTTTSAKKFNTGASKEFDSEATLDMTEVAKKWKELVDSDRAKTYINNKGGGTVGYAALLDAVTLEGKYTLVIKADSVISNDGADTVLTWKSNDAGYNVTTYFVQDGDAVYDQTSNTLTVTMKVRDKTDTSDINNKLDTYFTALYNESQKPDGDTSKYDFILDIDDSSIDLSNAGTYSVTGTFSGDVKITAQTVLGPTVIDHIDFAETTDVEYVQVNTPAPTSAPSAHSSGGGGRATATPTPTVTPTGEPHKDLTDYEEKTPLDKTVVDKGYTPEELEELGEIVGYEVKAKDAEGKDGVYGKDYTLTDKEGRELTPEEVNAMLSDPDVDPSDYNVHYSSGVTVTTTPIYRSGAQIDYNNHFAYIIGYPEGDVRPENNISRAEVATIFFRLLTDDSRAEYWLTTNSFSDVTSDQWYNNAISTVANAGIVNGYEDGTFRPDAPITRAEFATIASRFANATGVISASFSDISGHWSEAAVIKAASVGWVTGYEDGTFRPDNRITRAEAMAIVNRVTFRLVEADGLGADAIKWVDNPESAWYYAIVEEATNSHKYTRESIGDNETWTEVTEHRDWSKLEKETSDKAAIVVGIGNGALDYENKDGSIIVEEN